MNQWLPEDAVRKGIQKPNEITKFLISRAKSLAAGIHIALATENLDKQPDRLASLRKSDNFCLVILDACRYDALQQEFAKYFKGNIEPVKTPATTTFEYLQYNWTESYSFPYVTAAPPITSEEFDFEANDKGIGLPQDAEDLYDVYRGYIPANHFEDIIEVWRESWDIQLRVCPPEPVTKKAIRVAQGEQKMVVHYFQPHAPYIGSKSPSFEQMEAREIGDPNFKIDSKIWPAVQEGNISKKLLRKYYISNLQRVLGATAHLIRETEFNEYNIIGDHGEALGEYGGYQHGIDHPYVATVPWASVEEVIKGAPSMWNYTPSSNKDSRSVTTENRLRDLGYLD